MTVWYEFIPSDTLFFRGSEPLDPKVTYKTELLFPPSTSVISGAMRTAALIQKNISIREYKNGHEIKEQIGEYGSSGSNVPFSVIGPILKKNNIYYIPSPYSYYTEDNVNKKRIKILPAKDLTDDVIDALGIKGSAGIRQWVRHKKDIETIGGGWISLDAVKNRKMVLDTETELILGTKKEKTLFAVESRTGIEIDSNRSVKESRIYSANHIRLNRNVSMVWGIDRDCGISSEGVLTLGGEQRFGRYEKMQDFPVFTENGSHYMSLGPVKVDGDSRNCLIASGKIIYRGGWDLKKQFHKRMEPYYPPGSVFSRKINENCITF